MMTFEVATPISIEVSCSRCGNMLCATVQSGKDTVVKKAECWIKIHPCEHCLATDADVRNRWQFFDGRER